MEDFFEFMFGAGGRINRAKYWLSLFKLSIAGLLGTAVVFTAVGLAAPLFVFMGHHRRYPVAPVGVGYPH
jgi:hypothetical protein